MLDGLNTLCEYLNCEVGDSNQSDLLGHDSALILYGKISYTIPSGSFHYRAFHFSIISRFAKVLL
jgi:hypothetical protein